MEELFNILLIAKLGANAILGVSLAVCKAGAAHKVTLDRMVFLQYLLLYDY